MSLRDRLNTLATRVGTDVGLLEKRAFGRPLGAFEAALSRSWINPCRIVWLGSSTTGGVEATNPSLDYVTVATRRLQAAAPSITGGYEKPVVNVGQGYLPLDTRPGVQSYRSGLGGGTSETYIDATNVALILWQRPNLIVHDIGLFDALDLEAFAVPANEYETNVAWVVDHFNTNAVLPVSQVLVHSYRRGEVTPAKWATYRQALYNIARTRPNVMVIELQEEFDLLDAFGADPYDLIGPDGFHPSDNGHALIADIILKKMSLTIPQGQAHREHVLDTFTRPNATALYAPEKGVPWSTWTPLGTATAEIDDSTMRITTAGTVVVESGLADLEVDATITVPAPASTGLPGLVFRGNGDTNRMGLFCNATTSQVQLYRTLSGATTSVVAASHPFPAGTYHLQVRAQGNRVWCYVNGVKVIDYIMTGSEMAGLGGNTQIGFRNTVVAPGVYYHHIRASRL